MRAATHAARRTRSPRRHRSARFVSCTGKTEPARATDRASVRAAAGTGGGFHGSFFFSAGHLSSVPREARQRCCIPRAHPARLAATGLGCIAAVAIKIRRFTHRRMHGHVRMAAYSHLCDGFSGFDRVLCHKKERLWPFRYEYALAASGCHCVRFAVRGWKAGWSSSCKHFFAVIGFAGGLFTARESPGNASSAKSEAVPVTNANAP